MREPLLSRPRWSGSCLSFHPSTLRAPVFSPQGWQRLHSLLRASLLRACRPSTCSVPLHLPVNVDESAARPRTARRTPCADAVPVHLQRRFRFNHATDREQAPQARVPGGCIRLAAGVRRDSLADTLRRSSMLSSSVSILSRDAQECCEQPARLLEAYAAVRPRCAQPPSRTLGRD